MISILLLSACSWFSNKTDDTGCGPGFYLGDDGRCYEVDDTDTDADTDADADSDTDSDADSDADADADSDADADADSDADADCTPPDAWTGGIDPALYTNVPWDKSYDAGIGEIAAHLPEGGSSMGKSYLAYDATVVAVNPSSFFMYVGDANATVLVDTYGSGAAQVGDRIGFATTWMHGDHGESWLSYVAGLTILSSGNSVYARELGAETFDYLPTYNQLIHSYGEIDRVSNNDCSSGYLCFVITHDGTENLIRVPVNNDWGLDIDYNGGSCAEIVAPVSRYEGKTGYVSYLDVREPAWMRTW